MLIVHVTPFSDVAVNVATYVTVTSAIVLMFKSLTGKIILNEN